MKLYQNKDNYTWYNGWYGMCGSNCEPFDLYQPNLESIICIFEFTNDGVGFKTFTGNEHDFLNPFSELICGKGYVIVLKPGVGFIDIPNFTHTFFEEKTSLGMIQKDCKIIPLPEHPTPTPMSNCTEEYCLYEKNQLENYRDKFLANNFNSYQFDFNWSCFCQFEYTRKVTIYVENDQIASIVDIDTNTEIINGEVATYYTMNGLFDYIFKANEQHEADKTQYKINKDYFYIEGCGIDFLLDAVDDEMGFTVSNFIYNMIEPIPTVKPKILALHGGGESSVSFQNQPGMIDLVNSLSDFEFVFADAPTNNLWIQDPPYGKDYPTTDPNWASESISYIDDLISQHGEFFGILGFSQGAAFIPVYLANTSYNFNVAIMFNGYLPYTHTGLMQTINSKAPFSTPGVVFVGENDYNFKDMAEDLYAKFSYGPLVRSQTAGHHLPFASDVSFTEIVDYIISLTYSNDL